MEKLGVRTPAHPLVASLYIRRLFTNKTGDDYRHRMRSRRLTYEDLSRPSRWGSKLSNSNGTIWEIQLVPQRYLCRRWHIGSARADTTSLNSLSSKPWIPHSPQNPEFLTVLKTLNTSQSSKPWIPHSPQNPEFPTVLKTLNSLQSSKPWIPYSSQKPEFLTVHKTLNSLQSSKPWIPHSPQNHIGKTLTAKRPEWIFDQTEVKNIPMRCQSRTTWTLSFPIWWFKTQSYIIKMMPIFWLKKNTSIL